MDEHCTAHTLDKGLFPEPSAVPALSRRRELLRRHFFLLGVGSFVIFSSFLYGLSVGISKPGGRAHAAADFFDSAHSKVENGASLTRIRPLQGMTVSRLGKDVQINDRDAEMVSFVSDRTVKSLLAEQTKQWEQSGARVIGVATDRRGFAIGVNLERGERYSVSAWVVPPPLRETAAGGRKVQGIISIADISRSHDTSGAGSGEVPGIPVPDGGSAGAVFSSDDLGGRSWSGVYTAPGSLGDLLDFYREQISTAGWREVDAAYPAGDEARSAVGAARFVQGEEEVGPLLTPKFAPGAEQGAVEETVISASRGPRTDVQPQK